MTLKVSMSQQELSYGQWYVTVLQDGLWSLFDCAHKWMFSLGVNAIMMDSVAQGFPTHNTASIDYSSIQLAPLKCVPPPPPPPRMLCSALVSFFSLLHLSLTLLSTHFISPFTFTLPSCLHSFPETSLRSAYRSPYRIWVRSAFIIITSSFQRRVHFNFQTPACPWQD